MRCVLRAHLNAGVEFMEYMSKGRLFQSVWPIKDGDDDDDDDDDDDPL